MGAIKSAFKAIGEGIKGAFEGVGHIVKGAVTLNFDEVAEGVGGVVKGGLGAVMGGASLSPASLCASTLMDGAMSMLDGKQNAPAAPNYKSDDADDSDE